MAQAFLRPIEIGSTAKDLTVDGNPVALTTGTYACILTLLKELQSKIQSENANISIYIDSNHKVNFTDGGSGGCSITGVDEELAVLLGDVNQTITIAAGGTTTMAYTPQYCWFPTYQSSDEVHFGLRQNNEFAGVVSQNGRIAGITTGPALYFRTFEFMFEPATNVFASAESTKFSIGGNTYYPHATRCFEHFIQQTRIAAPAASTNPTPKGCWYVPFFENYEGSSPTWALPTTLGSYNGVKLEQSCDEDRYLYCHPDPGGADRPDNALPTGRIMYNVSFTLNSATAPTWTAP